MPKAKDWATYEEAKQWARTLQLTSRRAFFSWGKKHEWPADIPKAPYSTYKGKGWVDWDDFLGENRGKKKPPAGKKRKRGAAVARRAKSPTAGGTHIKKKAVSVQQPRGAQTGIGKGSKRKGRKRKKEAPRQQHQRLWQKPAAAASQKKKKKKKRRKKSSSSSSSSSATTSPQHWRGAFV